MENTTKKVPVALHAIFLVATNVLSTFIVMIWLMVMFMRLHRAGFRGLCSGQGHSLGWCTHQTQGSRGMGGDTKFNGGTHMVTMQPYCMAQPSMVNRIFTNILALTLNFSMR